VEDNNLQLERGELETEVLITDVVEGEVAAVAKHTDYYLVLEEAWRPTPKLEPWLRQAGAAAISTNILFTCCAGFC
jgi:hypothetical protein